MLRKLLDQGLTQADLAEQLGTSQPVVSRWLKGEREPQGRYWEAIRRLALKAGTIDEERPESQRQFIPIMGRVGAGGDVEPDMEQVPEEGLEQIELPGSAMIARTMVADPVGFRVVGDSMYPRFRDGDILVVEREQPWSIDRMIGDEAVILTVDSSGRSRRLVKRIMPGRRAHTYSLISLKDDTPPILDARIRWASPVRVIIPDIGLRVRPIPHQRPARRTGGP